MWLLSLKTEPTAEPLDFDIEVRPQCRLDPTLPADQLIFARGLIVAARMHCEEVTGRQLIDATWLLRMDSWYEQGLSCGDVISIPKPPLGAPGSVIVRYYDTSGIQQTLDPSLYVVVRNEGPYAQKSRLFPAYGQIWPTTQNRPAAIEIEFTAGYGADYKAVPKPLRQGMQTFVGELYERREEQTVGASIAPNSVASRRLWWPFRVGL